MTINDAVATRILNLLDKNNMTQYRLEKRGGMSHGSVDRIISGLNKTVTLTTIYRLSKGFGMSITEFLSDPIFVSQSIEIE